MHIYDLQLQSQCKVLYVRNKMILIVSSYVAMVIHGTTESAFQNQHCNC